MTTALTLDYTAPASLAHIEQTVAALRANNINVALVNSAAEALAKLDELIPAGATIMTGASLTLQEIGFEARLVSKDHPWVNLKDEMLAETDPMKQMKLRLQSTLAPYYLGSVQAITHAGEIVIASASGSQLPAFAFSSQNIIWVAGVQKIVPTLEDAMRRLREHNLPFENKRAQAVYGADSILAKILIVANEPPQMGRNVTLILVNEPVGV